MSRPVHSYSETFERATVDAQRRQPVLVPTGAWGSSEMFGISGTDREGCDYSRLAVELLQVLYREYPNRVALGGGCRSIVETFQFKQVWTWLFDHHIVCGSPDSGALTVSGMRAFHSAVRQYPDSAGTRRSGNEAGVASNLMLAMLRAHVFSKPSKSVLT